MRKLALLTAAFALVAATFYGCDGATSPEDTLAGETILLARSSTDLQESTTGVTMLDLGPSYGSWCTDLNARGKAVWLHNGWFKDEVSEFPDGFHALSVNNRGQVAGMSWWERYGPNRAAILDKGNVVYLLDQVFQTSVAWDINNKGQVVGDRLGTGAAGDIQAFIWEKGKAEFIPSLGGSCTRIMAINDRGQAVGASSTHGGPGRGCENMHAVVLNKGVLKDLGPGWAADINNKSEIVGSLDSRATVWRDGTPFSLGRLANFGGSWAEGINNRGQIVGGSTTGPRPDGGTKYSAFLWEDGEMRDLGTLGGWEAEACAIKENGIVVGWSSPEPGVYAPRAVMWLP